MSALDRKVVQNTEAEAAAVLVNFHVAVVARQREYLENHASYAA
jgi:hypothetical protein